MSGREDLSKTGGTVDGSGADPLYIFLHVPKTGGTSLKHILNKGIRKRQILNLYEHEEPLKSLRKDVKRTRKRFDSRTEIKDYLCSMKEKTKQSLRVISGHEIYYGIDECFNRNCRYFTFLREPGRRMVSLYNYQRVRNDSGRPLSRLVTKDGRFMEFEEFVEENGNQMTLYLAQRLVDCDPKAVVLTDSVVEQLKTVLEGFFFIGLTETMNDDFRYMSKILGTRSELKTRNKTSRSYVDYDEYRGFLDRHLKIDNEIYDFVKSIRHRRGE